MAENKRPEKDEISGAETTGHEWDGLKELNNPAPRWWLWVFFVTFIWSVGYWFIYPSWPTITGNTKGSKEWTQYKKLKNEQAEILEIRGELAQKIKSANFDEIINNPELYNFSLIGGKAAFKENCAACHSSGAQGSKGYPNLNDDDWLWGGKLKDIYTTIKYGIRSDHAQARTSQMPAFGKDAIIKPEEIATLADYVLNLKNENKDSKGAAIYKQNCASCHGDKGEGNHEFGAPNLVDAISLYGSSKENIIAQVQNPKHGVMPQWENRLPDEVIKQLAIYVYSLGGGEK